VKAGSLPCRSAHAKRSAGGILPPAMRNLLIVVVLLLAVVGCTTTPLPVVEALDSPAYAARQQRLAALDNWTLRGQVALNHTHTSLAGQLYWQQRQQQLDLNLRDTFGRNRLKISSDGQQATLDIDDKHYQTDDAEALLADVADLDLPLSRLPGWLRGAAGDECLLTALAVPQATITAEAEIETQATSEIDSGAPAALICDLDNKRWQISYHSWQQVKGESLPRKLTITGPDLTLKLAISRWQ
jgi:outer membrane lipoprotein LolB